MHNYTMNMYYAGGKTCKIDLKRATQALLEWHRRANSSLPPSILMPVLLRVIYWQATHMFAIQLLECMI